MTVDLADFLLQSGYHRIPLSRSGVGHFHTAGTLNGHPVSVLLDTGAASTILSLSRAHALELDLVKLPFQGGGAGAARMDLFHLPNAVLKLGDLTPRVRALMAMDLEHVNGALALKGEEPIDVIVGADVFEAHGAIIDYGSSSLFLKP